MTNSEAYRLQSGPKAMSTTAVRPSTYTSGAWPGTIRQTLAPPLPAPSARVPTYQAPSGPRVTEVGTWSVPLALEGITASSDTWPLRTSRMESPAASATTW